MADSTDRPVAASGRLAQQMPALLAGVGGCLFLTVWMSPTAVHVPPFLDAPGNFAVTGAGWWYVAVPVVATAAALGALRWWPYLLLGGGLLTVPDLLAVTAGTVVPFPVDILTTAGHPLTIVGVLACAQGLAQRSAGSGAVAAGVYAGAPLLGSALVGAGWLLANSALPAVHAVLVGLGFAGLLPAAWRLRRGDRTATGPAASAGWSWRRARPVVAGTLAVALAIPSTFLTVDRLAGVLDVPVRTLQLRGFVVLGIIGMVTLVAASVAASIAGAWSLAGALTAATAWVAAAAPMILAIRALAFQPHLRWAGVLAGVVIGAVAVAVGGRWRTPLAGAAAVAAATTLFVAYAATGGQPEKLAEQRMAVPALLILVAVSAAATSVTAAAARPLASRGVLPAAVGPVGTVLAGAGLQTVEVTYLRDGSPVGSYLNSVYHLPTSAVLLLVAGVGAAGLGSAHHVAARRAERRQAEEIERQAAAAERDRLARPIHDGVLQVLALVQRQGSDLGERGKQLATLAAEQEVALRSLLSGGSSGGLPAAGRPTEDLRAWLRPFGSPDVDVVAPGEPVALPARVVAELTAAVQAALDNVRRHAGPGARAWVLLEDEGEAVRVTVRDDGVGFAPERLCEAAAAGRLGVAQAMRGRIADLGGSMTIHSHPGEGTEVEYWVPRTPPAGPA